VWRPTAKQAHVCECSRDYNRKATSHLTLELRSHDNSGRSPGISTRRTPPTFMPATASSNAGITCGKYTCSHMLLVNLQAPQERQASLQGCHACPASTARPCCTNACHPSSAHLSSADNEFEGVIPRRGVVDALALCSSSGLRSACRLWLMRHQNNAAKTLRKARSTWYPIVLPLQLMTARLPATGLAPEPSLLAARKTANPTADEVIHQRSTRIIDTDNDAGMLCLMSCSLRPDAVVTKFAAAGAAAAVAGSASCSASAGDIRVSAASWHADRLFIVSRDAVASSADRALSQLAAGSRGKLQGLLNEREELAHCNC